MQHRKIAIYDTTQRLSFTWLTKVAQAIQLQMNRDVFTHWNVSAQVQAFEQLSQIPSDFWQVSIQTSVENGYNGVHWYHPTSLIPYAQVRYDDWKTKAFSLNRLSKVLSEEIIEMCVDPFGEKTISGKDWQNPNQAIDLLVEIGDPIASLDIGYYIDEIFVSNFIYPSYFNLFHTSEMMYDHLGLLQKPLDILDKSYQIFRRAGQWYKAFKIQGQLIFQKTHEQIPLELQDKKALTKALLAGLGLVSLLGLALFFKFRHKSPL